MSSLFPPLVKISRSEILGPHDPVTDHGESAEKKGADDPTNGWIPDQMRVVQCVREYLAHAEQCPANIPRTSPARARLTVSHPIGAGRLGIPDCNTKPCPRPEGVFYMASAANYARMGIGEIGLSIPIRRESPRRNPPTGVMGGFQVRFAECAARR